jgi:hypothetical protein
MGFYTAIPKHFSGLIFVLFFINLQGFIRVSLIILHWMTVIINWKAYGSEQSSSNCPCHNSGV